VKPVILALHLLLVCCIAFGQDKPEVLAQRAATPWLQLVDQEKYSESWQQASTAFKQAVTGEKWQQALLQVRKPLGQSTARNFTSAQYTISLPNAPPGEYVVLQYQSSFEQRNPATETVTLVLDGDKQWRTTGYIIR
jgi:hypothetical protein